MSVASRTSSLPFLSDMAMSLPPRERTSLRMDAATDDSKPGAKAEAGHQTQLKEAVDNLERGYNNDPDGKCGAGGQRGKQGIIAISAMDGAALASQKSIAVAAGTNIDQTALRDTNQTSGRRWIHNVRESVSLFVDGTRAKIADTFKIIAARGNVKLQAQDGRIEATARNNVEIASVDGQVLINAPKGILLTSGGGYIRIGPTIEIHNPEVLSMKAAHYKMEGPASLSVASQKFPANQVDFDQEFIVYQHNGKPADNRKFIVQFEDGGMIEGKTDGAGRTGLMQSLFSARHSITLLPPEKAS